MSPIEDTSKRDPLLHLAGVLGEGPSGYIEGMEAAGQRQLVASDQFPADAPWTDLEALGFGVPVPNEADPLFVSVTLPPGWQREASDHSMWSYIVDDQGRRRVAIFYKAAFYDRSAFARLEGGADADPS